MAKKKDEIPVVTTKDFADKGVLEIYVHGKMLSQRSYKEILEIMKVHIEGRKFDFIVSTSDMFHTIKLSLPSEYIHYIGFSSQVESLTEVCSYAS